ncbi:MAG: type II toxin-antitoxin system VapC family toxin [Myxococcota bacterium]
MKRCLYLDTSAVLRATLETGTSPELEARIGEADVLVTSRLSLVETARAFLRARQRFDLPEARLVAAEKDADAVWARCNIWELTPTVCEAACRVAPRKALRSLDALHLATFLAARERIDGLELLSADERLLDASGTV